MHHVVAYMVFFGHRWWHKCMSEMGRANQLALMKQSMILDDMHHGSTGQVRLLTQEYFVFHPDL